MRGDAPCCPLADRCSIPASSCSSTAAATDATDATARIGAQHALPVSASLSSIDLVREAAAADWWASRPWFTVVGRRVRMEEREGGAGGGATVWLTFQ